MQPAPRHFLNIRLDLMIPDTQSVSQLSHVISQAAAPAFILAALAGFTSLLIARQNRIVDRTIVLNGISDDDDAKRHLKADLPRLMRRAAMMNSNPMGRDQQYRDYGSGHHRICKRPF
jgi:hypothetical protein